MEEKKKKRHVGLKIVLSLVIILIVVPVVVIYACFYDNTTASFVGSDTTDNTVLFQKKTVDAFDSCADGHKIAFAISEDDLNQLLYTASKSLPDSSKDYLKKFTVSIENDSYHFLLDIQATALFATRVDITTNLTETTDAFVFKITDTKLGRIGGMDSLALSLGGDYLNDQTLTDLFANAGLHMTVALKDKTITYEKAKMIADLKSKAGLNNSMYSAILNDFLADGLISANFHDGKALSLNINLEEVHNNSTYCPTLKEAPLKMSDYRTKLKSLLDAKAIDVNADDEAYVFDYLVRGYEHASSQAKTYIDSATRDFSSVGISDIKTYEGGIDYNAKSIPDLVQVDLEASSKTLFASPTVSSISENEISSYLQTTSIYGYSYILSRVNDGASDYKVNAIAVDNFYSEIVNDHLYLLIGVNMNGYETTVIFDTLIQTSASQYQITLATDKVYYGSKEASGELKAVFYDLINQSFANSNWITFNNDTTSAAYGHITIDFENAIKTSNYYAALESYLTLNNKKLAITLEGQDLAAEGNLVLSIA
jgi:hypothetical protein